MSKIYEQGSTGGRPKLRLPEMYHFLEVISAFKQAMKFNGEYYRILHKFMSI